MIAAADGYNIQSMIAEALKAFKTKNGIYPQNVIIIRDGVGDSQKTILKDEIEQIQRAFQQEEETKNTKLIYSMVNTRIKTKFTQQGNQNPSPGTVIDHSVNTVNRDGLENNSFYLVSTECRQGVPTPSHYSILHDDIGGNPNDY